MKKILRLLSLAVVTVLALTACSNHSDNDTVTEQLLPGFFANVQDITSGATAVYDNVSYRVQLNYTKMTADVQISGLKLPDGTTFPTMTIPGLPWTMDNNSWKVIKGTNVTPSISGFSNAPVFNSFELRIFERILAIGGENVYAPGVCARYTVNTIYSVLSTYTPQVLYGKTESKASLAGSVFETKGVEYELKYNDATRNLTILMKGAKFAENMPSSFDIELRNVPVTVERGMLNFEVANITPYIENMPFDAFPITNLKGSFNPAAGLDFGFTCTPRNSPEAYNVTVACTYGATPEM